MITAVQALGGAQDAASAAATAAAAERRDAQWPPQFWDEAKRYAGSSGDGAFVRELAYVLVTLHRHGA